MATITTGRDVSCTLDPHLFTFKPKLNQKSNEIAQNLLSDFYQRQLQHVKRLQELQDAAAGDYRQWHARDKRQKHAKTIVSENKSTTDESVTNEDNPVPVKDNQQSNDRLARLFRIYQAPIPRKSGMATTMSEPRPARTVPRGSAPATVCAPAPPAPLPPPPPAASSATTVTVTRASRRMSPTHRSKSPPKSSSKAVRAADFSPKRPMFNENINTERLKLARDEAERAMKDHKIFTIIGPYPALREALRRRGWIEKFDRVAQLPGNQSAKKTNTSDDDDDTTDHTDELGDDDLEEGALDDDEDRIPPWEENDGYYGILSRLVKTAAPDFIWSVQASYDTSTLNKDQAVNHYSRNGCLTTKVGLCSSLRNLQWFHSGCSEEFYPRCYKLTHEDDKVAFVDDYRLTSCISFLRLVQNRCKGVMEPDMNSILAMGADNLPEMLSTADDDQLPPIRPHSQTNKIASAKLSPKKRVPSTNIEFALKKVEGFTLARDHEDIDTAVDPLLETTDEQWTHFIDQFYAASHSYAEIEGMEGYLTRVDQCLKVVEQHWPQYHIDGTRNIWILKPGAKSRGRGIVVYDRLEDILKLCSSTMISDRKFVVQKYIERPLLIHNTKFDIRQWFLVTDWNPLTIWIFKDCYLRFCTEHFNLATRQQNVHLCNYSIQKHFKNNSNRHADLPVENMWTSPEFIEKYLRPMKQADKWDALIYPAMKEAIICSMLVAQDSIDPRKNSFELYGADFMLGEDLKPWLIEINCSPTMARCTAVTSEMCDSVLEDTCKVMIDRKYNRTCDIGRFELIHKGTPVPVPIYVGIDLRVEGKTYKTTRSNNYHSASTVKSAAPANDSPPSSPSSSLEQLRRERTEPSLDRENKTSVSDGSTEKIEPTSDGHLLRSQSGKNLSNRYANKQVAPSSLLTVESLPLRPLTRSKVTDRLPASQAPMDITRLPKLAVRSRHVTKLIQEKLRVQNRKTRLSLFDEQTQFSSLIILNSESVLPD